MRKISREIGKNIVILLGELKLNHPKDITGSEGMHLSQKQE